MPQDSDLLSTFVSLIKLDELSSFGASKQARLPALIRIDSNAMDQSNKQRSLTPFSTENLGQVPINEKDPNLSAAFDPNYLANVSHIDDKNKPSGDKENGSTDSIDLGFQIIEMDHNEDIPTSMGPSLPAPKFESTLVDGDIKGSEEITNTLSSTTEKFQIDHQDGLEVQNNSSQLGDSLIDMVVNLRNENQSLIQALQRNNDYVRERIEDFKRISEESKIREETFAKEKADLEYQIRKLTRQNNLLSERLKNMELKLKDMKIEVDDSLLVADSSRATSSRSDYNPELYPNLGTDISRLETMDVADEELHDQDSNDSIEPERTLLKELNKNNDVTSNIKIGQMTKEQLSKHFDADKVNFYAIDDHLKQCDRLEQQLNEIGQRDYEICLMQQQLNIYRQNFRLERMEKLEAKIQIEQLKNKIDELCLKRVESNRAQSNIDCSSHDSSDQRQIFGVPTAGAERFIGRMGRKAARSAAKAARYAAKQAHLEEKAAAMAAKYNASQTAKTQYQCNNPDVNYKMQSEPYVQRNPLDQQHVNAKQNRHSRRSNSGSGGIKSELVSDLWQTANKAMMTGYKMASTHVNLALDKLNEFEQTQAAQLDKGKQSNSQSVKPSAPVQSSSNNG